MPVTIQEARRRLEQSLTFIPERLRAGLATAEWQAPTLAAANVWKTAMQRVVQTNRWETGVQKAGNEKWKRNTSDAVDKMVTRLRGALDLWARQFAPVLDAMNSAAARLPPKTPDYRQNIVSRVTPIVEAAKRAAGKL
jgi:hypothetical protein